MCPYAVIIGRVIKISLFKAYICVCWVGGVLQVDADGRWFDVYIYARNDGMPMEGPISHFNGLFLILSSHFYPLD